MLLSDEQMLEKNSANMQKITVFLFLVIISCTEDIYFQQVVFSLFFFFFKECLDNTACTAEEHSFFF